MSSLKVKPQNGYLISFEGIEGVGKSTQVQLLADYFTSQNIPCIKTREPGGTSVGNQIRSCLLSEHDFPLHAQTELCLLLGARYDHWQNIVLPALRKGMIVIIDRFIDATIAYQGYGRGLSISKIIEMHKSLDLDIQPDLTLLLDMPVDKSRQRMNTRGFSDRIEKEKDEFFHKVRTGYLEIAQNSNHMKIIDASSTKESIYDEITNYVNNLIHRSHASI